MRPDVLSSMRDAEGRRSEILAKNRVRSLLKIWLAVVCASVLLLAACGSPAAKLEAQKLEADAYRREVAKWQAGRASELTSANGWLTLVGLFWLKEGENRFGGDASNEITLPQGKVAPFAGSLWLEGGAVRLEARKGVGITHEGKPVDRLVLQSDADGQPTVLNIGSISFHTIKRGERTGLRVRDTDNPARSNFAGLDFYPVEPAWRVEARFEPYDPSKMIPIVNVLGMVEEQESPGALVFEVGGKSYRLDAIREKGSEQLFIIFADQTSGRETYGAGRYLYADPPRDGRAILDFNKAYNPPCAFTNYATCPLPPSQNRLALRIEAGEKRYAAESTH